MSERNDARVQREAPNGIVQFQLLREDGRYCEALYALDRDGVLWLRWYENEEWGQWVRCNATLDATGHETAGSEAEERDAALRALEEKGTGLGTPMPKSEATDSVADAPTSPVSPSPAPTRSSEPRSAATPIPLGAVVEVEGDRISPFTRCNGYWRDRSGNTWADDGGLGFMLAALYHARHPVATRETVERVRKALFQAFRETRVGEDFTENCTRAALSAAGFQEAGDGTP